MPSAADVLRPTDRAASENRLWFAASLALLLGTAAIIALFWDSVSAALAVWSDASAHRVRYFVLPIAAYFVWLRRHEVRAVPPSPTVFGLLLALPFAMLWLVSHAAAVRLGEQIAVVGLIQALLLGVLGPGIYRVLLFPFLLLWLLIPAGDSLVPWLLDLTTWMTTVGLNLGGVPPQVEGNLIIVPSGSYKVVEECAALDFLLGSLVIALVFAGLMYNRFGKRLAYIAAALSVAMLANGVRTTTVVLITHLSDGKIDLASDHAAYGWILFFLATLLTMAVGHRFRDTPETLATPRLSGVVGRDGTVLRVVVVALGIMGLSGFAPAYAVSVIPKSLPASAAARLCLPDRIGPWTRSGAALDWQPLYPGADGQAAAPYGRDEAVVNLHVLYYWAQTEGAEMIGWGNRLADDETTWFWSDSRKVRTALGDQPLSVQATRLRSKQRRLLIWQWYWVDGRFTSSPALAKLLQAKATLLQGDPRAAVILVAAEEKGAPQVARAALHAFTAEAGSLAEGLTAELPCL